MRETIYLSDKDQAQLDKDMEESVAAEHEENAKATAEHNAITSRVVARLAQLARKRQRAQERILSRAKRELPAGATNVEILYDGTSKGKDGASVIQMAPGLTVPGIPVGLSYDAPTQASKLTFPLAGEFPGVSEAAGLTEDADLQAEADAQPLAVLPGGQNGAHAAP